MANQVTYGPYSPIVKKSNFYFVSGQLGIESTSKEAPASIEDQVHLMFANLKILLKDYDLCLDDVIKTTLFVTDIDNFSTVNNIYLEYFKEPRPARSCVEVKGLPKVTSNNIPAMIEMEAVAYKEPQ